MYIFPFDKMAVVSIIYEQSSYYVLIGMLLLFTNVVCDCIANGGNVVI